MATIDSLSMGLQLMIERLMLCSKDGIGVTKTQLEKPKLDLHTDHGGIVLMRCSRLWYGLSSELNHTKNVFHPETLDILEPFESSRTISRSLEFKLSIIWYEYAHTSR